MFSPSCCLLPVNLMLCYVLKTTLSPGEVMEVANEYSPLLCYKRLSLQSFALQYIYIYIYIYELISRTCTKYLRICYINSCQPCYIQIPKQLISSSRQLIHRLSISIYLLIIQTLTHFEPMSKLLTFYLYLGCSAHIICLRHLSLLRLINKMKANVHIIAYYLLFTNRIFSNSNFAFYVSK